MNSPRPIRLVMAPLVCCLTLAASVSAPAAPSKKTPPPAPPVVETPAPKKSFLKKLNPFQKKEPPPAPAAAPAPVKNSKKSAPVPAPVVEPKPPGKSLATAKTLPPAPVAVEEESKKPGFFSRLKSKLNQAEEPVDVAEKPARPTDWKERWVVTDESTAFFEYGPSQSNGPDLRLPRGQVVKLAQAKRGWARVELDGGRQGYIGTDQMRQATEQDFAPPLLPSGTQLAAVGAGGSLQGWSPIAPPPDLPDLPMAAGMEDSLLLLPPLEFEGTELKKSSLRLKPLAEPSLTLQPGDSLPPTALEPPVLEPIKDMPAAQPSLPAPAEPAPVSPAAPATPVTAEPAPAADPATPAAPSPADPS